MSQLDFLPVCAFAVSTNYKMHCKTKSLNILCNLSRFLSLLADTHG